MTRALTVPRRLAAAREGAASRRVGPATSIPRTSAVTELLELQRLHGNRFVSRALSQKPQNESLASRDVRDGLRPIQPPPREAAIRRKVGFEFESPGFSLGEAVNPAMVPANGDPFPTAAVADSFMIAGAGAGPAGVSTPIAKGKTVLSAANLFELQADDSPVVPGSDPEIVTPAFEETVDGRELLARALARMRAMNARLSAHPLHAVPAAAIAGDGVEVSRPRAFIGGLAGGPAGGRNPQQGLAGGPQVTMGLGLKDVTAIVEDLHDAPGETPVETQARNPGRLGMRGPAVGGPPNVPKPLGASEGSFLVNGLAQARAAIATYQGQQPAHVHAPGGPELEGLLTVIYAYHEAGPSKLKFLKNKTPLLAKTDFATTWTTLPTNVKLWFRMGTRFEDLVAAAPGYPGQMDGPLFDTAGRLSDEVKTPDGANDAPEWYKSLTLRQWIRGMKTGRNLLGNEKPGKDYLSQKNFPQRPRGRKVEGYAALGSRMDPGGGATANPVFELRSVSAIMDLNEFSVWALKMFDYIRSVNADNPARIQ